VNVHLLDIEWLLSTLFDASLLTFEPPATAALFYLRQGWRLLAAGNVNHVARILLKRIASWKAAARLPRPPHARNSGLADRTSSRDFRRARNAIRYRLTSNHAAAFAPGTLDSARHTRQCLGARLGWGGRK
jgi:hypothetical protein